MRTFTHVLYTWLLAIIILPVILIVIDIFSFPYGVKGGTTLMEYLLIPFFLLFLSVPTFLISLAFINSIITTVYSNVHKLFLWYLATILTAMFNLCIPGLILFGGVVIPILSELLLMWGLPIAGAVVLSITIRYKHFFSLNKFLSEPINNN